MCVWHNHLRGQKWLDSSWPIWRIHQKIVLLYQLQHQGFLHDWRLWLDVSLLVYCKQLPRGLKKDCQESGNHTEKGSTMWNPLSVASFLTEERISLACIVQKTPDIIELGSTCKATSFDALTARNMSYKIGDPVWVQSFTWPWWPSVVWIWFKLFINSSYIQVFSPQDAPSSVRRQQKKHGTLVKFFGTNEL